MDSFKIFSEKQIAVLTWWRNLKYANLDAVICDGAVRSGKTLCMSISFVMWSMCSFHDRTFAICGKTITSLTRNVITPLLAQLEYLGFACEMKVSKNYIDISFEGRNNRYYLFGGKDESSASFIQGITLTGVMFDEVALMPRSFVEQALARCSVEHSKFWFNCNPEHPYHWFYCEWIQKAIEKKALYLHFEMKDNPSLSKDMLKRYKSLYSGSFYERFVLGRWVSGQGLIYPAFHKDCHVVEQIPCCEKWYISCDYGTVNPMSMGLWGFFDGVWYRVEEYYYNSKIYNVQKTDEEYYLALVHLAGDRPISSVVVDPSAASFIECIRRHNKFHVIPAHNDVLTGIQTVSRLLQQRKLLFHKDCLDCIREFSLYIWDENSTKDVPVKQNDHAMDDIRYFVMTLLADYDCDFFATSTCRESSIDRGLNY